MPGEDQARAACAQPVGTVTNVQRFSLHDGGGIRTVGFLKGCPFRCPWCCNPENLSFAPEVSWKARLCIHCSMAEGGDGLRDCPRTPDQCPTGAKELMGHDRGVAELTDDLLRDMPFFEESGGGVTLSGGECLAGRNLAFSLAVLEECHRRGANTAVETTLAVPLGQDVGRLVACVDTFLVDFKIADGARSREQIGLDPDVRDANLREVLRLGGRVVARMPIIPGYTDAAENVAANVARIRELGIARADVLPFHQLGEAKYDSLDKDYGMRGVAQLTDADVQGVVDACEAAGLAVTVHGE